MSLRTEYIRNFYADHQINFGQPDGTPAEAVRAAALREFDEWLREVKAEAWDEGEKVGYVHGQHDAHRFDPGPDWRETPNPYRASETA